MDICYNKHKYIETGENTNMDEKNDFDKSWKI